VFSPTGTAFYFTWLNPTTTFRKVSLLCVSHWRGGKGSTPEVPPFSGKNMDFPARLSPDGQTLYFSSSGPLAGLNLRGFRICRVTKSGSSGNQPEGVAAGSTEDGHSSLGPSVTRDGLG